MEPRKAHGGQWTWDDLLAWGIAHKLDPETPLAVSVGDKTYEVHTVAVVEGQVVLVGSPAS